MESSAADTIPARRRKWVWHSTPDSIKAGQISLFAIAETPVATLVFGWLLFNNPWPWTSVIGLMAAPILLLRSDASVEMGLAMLRRYDDELGSDELSGWMIAISSVLGLAIGAGTALSFDALVPYPAGGWSRLAWGALLVGGALTAGVALVFSFGSLASSFTGMVAALFGSAAFLGWQYSSVALAGSLFGAGLIGMSVWVAQKSGGIFSLILAPGLALGTLGRTIFIRLWASLSHLRAGLAGLAANWRNTVVLIDPAHLPELLPRAGEIDDSFALPTLLRDKREGAWIINPLLAIVIYLPALAYRWNIKASWWLWGPVALLLRPASWRRDEDMRCATAFWSTWAMQTVLVGALITLAGWLAWPVLPREFQALLPNAKLVHTFIASPHFSLRLVLAASALFCLGMMLLNAYRVRSAHAKALEGAADFHKSYDEGLRADLRAMARPLRRWQQATAALMIFTIWSFALKFALDYWPGQTGHAVWRWLLPWL